MKTKTNFTKGILAGIIALTLVAFSTSFEKKKVDVQNSKITWTGEKLTGSHEGTINLNEGYFEMKDGKLVGGEFTADMTSITVTDLEGDSKKKLEGHLNSDDFFGVKKYPTAKFTIKTAAEKSNGVYGVSGDLTIKGKTNPIAFDLKMSKNTAKTTLVIDRTKYDIRYGSGSFFDDLGDKTIYDEFTLDIMLKF
ncbi:YceI family protein [Mesohalobacter halotolerans]|uniref:YceI family protein n=1 Tax=Mesohalobacter halotolerans TaxID=1883405 RepID=A0A4U5TQT0_9FLAO|nr:YceI family protein [Mesohalobacter halotolerans]TKS55714.1 YceI family protein [Mesohalobacter halotolerans]